MAIQDGMLSPRDNLGYYRNSNILAKHLYLGNTWYCSEIYHLISVSVYHLKLNIRIKFEKTLHFFKEPK